MTGQQINKWLFDPFVYVAGGKALLAGWVAMAATAVIGYYSHTHFDGAIDVHAGYAAPLLLHFAEQLIIWICTVAIFYPAGLLFSRSAIRLIDVAGTMALARWPMIFCAITGFGIHAHGPIHSTDDALKSITGATICCGIVIMLFAIWMIALMVNAFKLSCNLKGGKLASIFIIALLITEILSNFIIHHTSTLLI